MTRETLQQLKQTVLYDVFGRTGLHRLFSPVYAGIGTILVAHRVLEPGARPRVGNPQIELSPSLLESVVDWFLEAGYDVVSLEEAIDRLRSAAGKTSARSRRFVSFTFDDGYADNLTAVHPIFARRKLPFTIYVTTSFPDGDAFLWWYALEDLLLQNERLDLGQRHYSLSTPKEKAHAFDELNQLFTHADASKRAALREEIFGRSNIDVAKYARELPLGWSDIAALAKDPLVTIGAHTVNHYALSSLDARAAESEIRQSKETLESRIGQPVRHLTYPYGSRSTVGARDFALARAAGFSSATTTREGHLFAEHAGNLFSLPRVPVSESPNGLLYVQMLASGFLPALRQRLRRVVTV